MELQAQLTALEEEVGMLKGEIKSILQEVRVAVLARQNPFLSDDFERALPSAAPSLTAPPPAETPASPSPISQTPAAPQQVAGVETTASQVARIAQPEVTESEDGARNFKSVKRPVDLAALMVWVQEAAESFSHTEFVMLVTLASYADFFDEGLKQALVDMSLQISREHESRASMTDFSLALKQLEAIRTTSRHRQVA